MQELRGSRTRGRGPRMDERLADQIHDGLEAANKCFLRAVPQQEKVTLVRKVVDGNRTCLAELRVRISVNLKRRTLAALLGERGRVSAPSPARETPGADATGLASDLPGFLSISEAICQTSAKNPLCMITRNCLMGWFCGHHGRSQTGRLPLAEQGICFVVIDRHITQGSRSEAGQRWLERIWTIVATCTQQSTALRPPTQRAGP